MNPNHPIDPYIELVRQQGTINERYTNLTLIGQGAFSFVMRAYDKQSRKEVALKFLHPNVQDAYRRQCFEREIEVLSQLNGQPNIMPLVEGLSTLVVTLQSAVGPFPIPFHYYVAGLAQSNLKDYIYSGNTNPILSLQYFREVCKGVQRLHSNIYCHRDLKPDNFLIYGKRDVCLSDFGTARSLADGAERFLRTYDFPVGDVRYSPVELWCGLGNEPEMFYAADVFALGAILFELFTQSILTDYVYESEMLKYLCQLFQPLPTGQRKQLFIQMLDGIVAHWHLPEIQDFEPSIPASIVGRINRLYKQLAHLDYRKRMSRGDASGRLNFTPVFQDIDRCIKILEHQKAYERLQEYKRKRAENLKKKEERQKAIAKGEDKTHD